MPDPEPKRGVWAWIASVAPPQELDEIARAIGRKTIDRNAELWQELEALTEILDIAQAERQHDFTAEALLRLPTPEQKQPAEAGILATGLMSARSEPSLRCVSRRTTRSIASAPEILTSLQDKMTIDKIDEVRDSLLAAFGNEEDELLTDIAMLTTVLDEETDAILRSSRRPDSAKPSARKEEEKEGSDKAPRAGKESKSEHNLAASTDRKAVAPTRTARKTSKLRQTLQEARDTVHFI